MKRYALSEGGHFICDLLHGQKHCNWTSIPCPDGLINGRLVGAKKQPDGEWVGGYWAGDEEPPVVFSREQIEQYRLRACADPITGSDRHFSEALRREAAGDVSGAEQSRAVGAQRYEQIKAQYPWPLGDN